MPRRRFVPPQLAETVEAPPRGDGWLHEIELDGYRILGVVEAGRARLVSRGRRDWTDRFPVVAAALAALPVRQAVLDGEVALVDEAGRTDRRTLDRAMKGGVAAGAVYFVFDLLELDGEDLTGLPLVRRKERLAGALAAAPPAGPVRASLHVICDGEAFLAQARAFGVPGIVSKRVDRPHVPGRGPDWRKTRCERPAPAEAGPRLARRPLPPVRLTNPERVLYPEAGITKHDLARFYADTAEWILPHLAGRPLSIVRCPDGLAGPRFYQKHAGAAVAASLVKPTVGTDGIESRLVVGDLADLVSLVQIGTLEIHVWGSRVETIERPDRLVLDLDPDPALSWSRVVQGAREIRDRLAEHGLASFVKTTGGKGLHVVAPLAPVHEWPIVKAFARRIAVEMAADTPGGYTIDARRTARRGRILIDYLRNARGATAIAPYSTRAAPGAPVAVPMAWDELSSIRPVRRTVRDLGERLAALVTDPWQEMARLAPALPRRVVDGLRRSGQE